MSDKAKEGPVPNRNDRIVQKPVTSFDASENRRAFLLRAIRIVKGASLLLGVGMGGLALKKGVEEVGEILTGPSEEQKRAAKFLEEATQDDLVTLRSLDLRDHEVNEPSVMMRKRPSTHTGTDPNTGLEYKFGDEIRRIKPNQEVVGIKVVGNDPEHPYAPAKTSDWIAFRDSENPSIVAFAHSSGFNYEPKLEQVKAFDVRKP